MVIRTYIADVLILLARRFIADDLESIVLETLAFHASVLVAAPGLIALLLVWWRWSWLSRFYREAWAKCAVAIFRAIAAFSAIAAKSAPSRPGLPLLEQPWTSTVIVAILGYLFWEIAGAIGDHKSKAAKERAADNHKQEILVLRQDLELANQDKDDAVLEAYRLKWLLTHLHHAVNEKCQRIRKIAQATAGSRASIPQARDGLAPDKQVQILLELLASLFRYEAVHRDPNSFNQNFRVGLFVEQAGRLEPLNAFDLVTRNHKPFSSFAGHTDRYRLDNDTNPSQAVRCVREGQTIIIPDCLNNPGFDFFNDRQRLYLKSMVAHPLAEFYPDGITPASAALLIDTDVPGFFSEEDRETIEQRLNEFAARIGLEYALVGLTRSSGPQGRRGDGGSRV